MGFGGGKIRRRGVGSEDFDSLACGVEEFEDRVVDRVELFYAGGGGEGAVVRFPEWGRGIIVVGLRHSGVMERE